MISVNLIKIEQSIKSYFPENKTSREESNIRLAKDVGYALGMYKYFIAYAQSAYYKFIVSNSNDLTGIVINQEQWMDGIKSGASKYRKESNMVEQ